MPVHTVTYRPETGKPAEDVEADTAEVDTTGLWLVLRRTVLVVGRPREVVVRRIDARDVARVESA